MQLGMIGLGRMGANMAERLVRGGHRVVGFDPGAGSARAGRERHQAGGIAGRAGRGSFAAPRVLWLMVPAGKIVDDTLARVAAAARRRRHGDRRRQLQLQGHHAPRRRCWRRRASHYVDCGTSGGVWGLAEGYSLMIGGDDAAVERLRPIFETLAPAPDRGWGRVGPERRRPLHQDGPQRHRVRPDAGLCRGLRDHAAQGRLRAGPAPGRRDLAPRQRGALLAARPDRGCAGQEPGAWTASRLTWPTRAKAAGPWPRPSTSTSPRR